MPAKSRRAALHLSDEVRDELAAISRSRTEASSRVQRAQMLLAYASGETVSGIARRFDTNRPKVERSINKALQFGALPSLADLPRPGKPTTITAEARAWVISLACQKPKDLGYSYELWTTELLARHVRAHCLEHGHRSLCELARGTVSKLLAKAELKPHKISYYLERRDPEFEPKMAQVLCVYRQVELLSEQATESPSLVAYLSYDEKPGIQALGNLAPDLLPVPGDHPCLSRDHQYKRHGTMTLMAGIDLLTGRLHGQVKERHRSREFIEFLQQVDAYYPEQTTIRIILDNHSAHTSKETRAYLATAPNRFEFIFTPTHGSWLNLIEGFFAKMAKTMLRGIRVNSKTELVERILQYLEEINAAPVVHTWKYRTDSTAII
jgi:transposase